MLGRSPRRFEESLLYKNGNDRVYHVLCFLSVLVEIKEITAHNLTITCFTCQGSTKLTKEDIERVFSLYDRVSFSP